MNKHTTITKKIAAFSLAAVSCASLMLAPMNGIAAPLQNFCITASASSDNYKKDTVVLDNNRSVTLSAGKQRHWFSQNGKYQLTLTAYGNLVLKETNSGNTIWSTGLGNDYSSNRSFKLVMQTDGNLVLYDKNSKAKWDSRTLIKGGGIPIHCVSPMTASSMSITMKADTASGAPEARSNALQKAILCSDRASALPRKTAFTVQ